MRTKTKLWLKGKRRNQELGVAQKPQGQNRF